MPTIDKGCVTHHGSCDCREAQFHQVARLLDKALDYTNLRESQRVHALRTAKETMDKMGYKPRKGA